MREQLLAEIRWAAEVANLIDKTVPETPICYRVEIFRLLLARREARRMMQETGQNLRNEIEGLTARMRQDPSSGAGT